MDGTLLALIVVGIAVVMLIGGFAMARKRRQRKELQTQFGPEYERAVGDSDGRGQAERELKDRAARVEKLHIKELTEDERHGFADTWTAVQSRFVDDPGSAIVEADRLIQQVMDKRGYPITDFDQQAADISVDHPEVVSNYRAAHQIAETHGREGVNTEGLRQAMIHYRALFEELLGETAPKAPAGDGR